jgi:hypothetical protein
MSFYQFPTAVFNNFIVSFTVSSQIDLEEQISRYFDGRQFEFNFEDQGHVHGDNSNRDCSL